MATASILGDGIEGQARWSLRLFGRFELSGVPGGERVALHGKRERVLLAYLAVIPNCRQQRRKLATLLWGDASDETALDNLRTCIWGLRKGLGETGHCAIASEGEDIVLDAAAFDVDVVTFRRLAAQSGRSELEGAAHLSSGEFLDGLEIENEEFESWRRAETTRCRDQTVDVLSRLMRQLSEGGETERAIEMGVRILGLEPLHEATVRRLMRLCSESGRRGAAVQLYRTLAEALKTELDAQPEAETRLLFAHIARGGEERTQASVVPAAVNAKPPSLSPSLVPASDEPGEAPRLSATQLSPADGAARQMAPQLVKARPLNWILAGGLAAALTIFLLYQFAPTTAGPQPGVETAQGTPSFAAGTISIAVLPFVNVSSDADQEFFSDGITDEISSALAKIADLRMVGRSSAFQFKGENKDLRAIGQALGATHLIEGTVRKEGARVRISAQLVEADNGLQVWAENYDRELTDIFAVQEDIATAIAGALRVPLGLAPGKRLLANSAIAPESYEQYLRARTIWRSRNQTGVVGDRFAGAISMLEQVVARDPGYAPAWALLGRMSNDRDKSEMAAREALRLDPRNATYSAMVGIQAAQGNWAVIEGLRKQALAQDPNDPDGLDSFSNQLALAGRLKESLSIREKLHTLEPFVPVYNYITASIMVIAGQSQGAIPILEALPAAQGRNTALAHAYAEQGLFGEAADTLLLETPQDRPARRQVEEAARLLRNAPTKVKASAALAAFDRELSFVYLYIGAPDRVLDYQERQVARYPYLGAAEIRYLWSAEFAPVRKSERFKTFVRKMRLVDYWRARGWPDLCRPVGADDFVCA